LWRTKTTKRFVFENLTNPAWINRPLKNGLQKQESIKISLFTASVILLLRCNLSGTDIYTVSKMLGHTNVKTTQVYAKVIDEKKNKAAEAIQLKFLKII
jgi:integrase